jgi:hypothetical protein
MYGFFCLVADFYRDLVRVQKKNEKVCDWSETCRRPSGLVRDQVADQVALVEFGLKETTVEIVRRARTDTERIRFYDVLCEMKSQTVFDSLLK